MPCSARLSEMRPGDFLVNTSADASAHFLSHHSGAGRHSCCAVVLLRPEANGTSLPTVPQLLVSGGDARIALDPQSGLNRYACRPYPDPSLLAFGSSTASVISPAGLAAAEALRDRVLVAAETDTLDEIYDRELQRIRLELLALLGLSDAGVALEFASSGTDAHAWVAAANAADRPLTVVMVEESETGSGVAAALQVKNATVIRVPLRGTDGAPRPLAELDAEVGETVAVAVRSGGQVLLVMVDQSKTGLIAPSPACVALLHRRYAARLQVLVDACQLRLAPATLHAYLQQGFMVAVTGSKFLSGPSFSAALLLPEPLAQRLKLRQHESGMTVNWGLLLRWEAALAEKRRFRAVPQAVVLGFMQTFAQAITGRLNNDPCFESLPVHPMARSSGAQSWDQIQTIFPFLLYRITGGRVPLNRDETQQIYRRLPGDISSSGDAGVRCQLGQPVACGTRDGVAVSALRLCLSARLISDAFGVKGEGKGIDGVIAEAMAALDKTSGLIRSVSCRVRVD